MFSFFNRSRSDSPVQEPVRVENPTQAKVQPVAPQTRQVPVGTLPIQLDPRYIRESLPEVDFGYVSGVGVWIEVCGYGQLIPFNQIFDLFITNENGFNMLHINTPDEPFAIAAIRNIEQVYQVIAGRMDWNWANAMQQYYRNQPDEYEY